MKTLSYILLVPLVLAFMAPQLSIAKDNDQSPLFKSLDKNSDGKITKDEISEDQNKFYDRLLRIGDQDDNGELSQAEFTKAINRKEETVVTEKNMDKNGPRGKKGKGKGKERNPGKLFDRLDKNNDGKLSGEETNGKGKGMINRLYKALNKEPGDDITKEEFVKMAGKFGKKPGAKYKNKKPGEEQKPGKPERKFKGQRPEGKGLGQRGGHPPHPKFFKILDQNKDHKLSKEELSQAVKLIDQLDEDDDGMLSPREIFGHPPRGFAGRGDKNGNKQRPKKGKGNNKNPKEFGKQKGLNSNKRADKFMERFDKDGDDKLSAEELPRYFNKKFDSADSNDDGFISKDELGNMLQGKGKGNRKKKN